jgi:hypothetical protein
MEPGTVDVRAAVNEIAQLKARLNELESRTNLISEKFLKRAFAVMGHYLVASLVLILPIWVIAFVIGFALAASR